MKLLILSCNTGGGHNSAGRAIGEYFEKHGHSWEMVNALEFMPEYREKFISGGHDFAYRHLPKAYGVCYRIEERHPSRAIYNSNAKYSSRLMEYIKYSGCDAVLCVHLFPCIMATELRRRGLLDVPVYFLATDYTCSPGVSDAEPDKFFIPHPDLGIEFIRKGVSGDRLVPTGIPVGENFYVRGDRAAARRSLGLPEEGQMVLITSGSMGCGPVEGITKKLLRKMPGNAFMVAVCGQNRKLYKNMEKLRNRRLYVLAYTHKMNDLMDAADIMLIKAGGLSTTEAAAKGLPIIYMDAVPGCETRNIQFMVGHGFALTAGGVRALAELVCDCLEHPEKGEKCVETRGSFFRESAAARIYDCMAGVPV